MEYISLDLPLSHNELWIIAQALDAACNGEMWPIVDKRVFEELNHLSLRVDKLAPTRWLTEEERAAVGETA